MEKRVIVDPLREIEINGWKFDSLISLYVERRDLYSVLIDSRNKYRIKIVPLIQTFFKNTPKHPKKYTIDQRIEYYTKKWQDIIAEKVQKDLRENAWKEEIKRLMDATASGEYVWEELYSGLVSGTKREILFVLFEEKSYKLDVTAIRDIDVGWKVWMELSSEDSAKTKTVYPKEYNGALYKVVKKTAVRKQREETHIKRGEPGKEKSVFPINSDSFVVRTNLFRCFHKEHLLEEIIGLLSIVTPMGKIITEKIPCAYCAECKCFYMLSSVYKQVSEKGVLLCQLIDSSEYYESGVMQAINGAGVSLLMQNGYNVRARNGLTEMQRQLILGNIIDNGIMAPHCIISYIDMFIAQKKNLVQYSGAVDKWRKDREYVLKYNAEGRREVGIGQIVK